MTNYDGLSITGASYDLTTQTLTVNVNVNTSASDYVTAPTEFHLFTDDGTFTNPQERPLIGFTENGSNASLTIGNITPIQLNNLLNNVGGIGLYVDVSSPGASMNSSPTFYQGAQLTAAAWPSGSTTQPPTISGDFTDTLGTINAITVSNGVNFVNGANDTSTQTLTGTADANVGVTVYITDGNNTPIGNYVTKADGSGNWSIPVGDVVDGTYNFTAIATNGPSSTSSQTFSLTVDTQAPVVTVTSTGGLTNSNEPAVTGTVSSAAGSVALAGATVTLYEGSKAVGTGTVGTDGLNWTATVSSALSDGSNTLYAQVTDNEGLISASSNTVTLDVATQPPVVTIDQTGSITNQNQQVISGTLTAGDAPIGSTITLSDNGNAIGTATVGQDGKWSTTVTLGESTNAIVASITDQAGNSGSASVSYTLDTQPPVVTIDQTGSITNQNQQVISGTLTAGDAPIGSTITLSDNGKAIGTATVGQDGKWSTTVTLGESTNAIVASITDQAGNSGSASVSYTLDTQPPVVTIDQTGSITNQNQQVISGTLTAGDAPIGSTITLSDNGKAIGTATVGQDGKWSTTVTLGESTNAIVASITDQAGNSGSASVSYTLDTQPPVVTIDQTGSITNQNQQVISGTLTAGDAPIGSTITLSDNGKAIGTATVGQDGKWSTTVTLGESTNAIVASITDQAGNSGSASVSYTLDTQPPVVTIDQTGSITNQNQQVISGTLTAGDAPIGSTITLSDNGKAIGTATVGQDGKWSTTVTLGESTNAIVASITDQAGNSGSASVSYTLDTQPPVVTIDQTGSITNQNQQVISGTLTAGDAPIGSTITLSDNGTAVGTATVGSNGKWSTTVTLTKGTNNIVASITDAAGNSGSASLVDTLDTTPPTITSVSENIIVGKNKASVTVNAAVQDSAGISSVTFNGQGGSLTQGTDTNGTWSETGTTKGATFNPNPVIATDLAGNTASASGSKVAYNKSTQTLNVLGTAGGDTVSTSESDDTVSIHDTAGGHNKVTASGGSSGVTINDTDGGDTVQISGNANAVVFVGSSNASTVTVSGTTGYDRVTVTGGANVSITDTASHSGHNTVNAYDGNNLVTISDKSGGDMVLFSGDNNTVTLSGTGGGDTINLGRGRNNTLALDALGQTYASGAIKDVVSLGVQGHTLAARTPQGGADNVTNFQATGSNHDMIDLSALGVNHIESIGDVITSGLANDSVSWLTVGKQSAVFINSHDIVSEALVVNGSLNTGDFKLASVSPTINPQKV